MDSSREVLPAVPLRDLRVVLHGKRIQRPARVAPRSEPGSGENRTPGGFPSADPPYRQSLPGRGGRQGVSPGVMRRWPTGWLDTSLTYRKSRSVDPH